MVEQGWHHTGLTQLVEVESMHQRKKTMADLSDAISALPGGCGTLEELLEIIILQRIYGWRRPTREWYVSVPRLPAASEPHARWHREMCIRDRYNISYPTIKIHARRPMLRAWCFVWHSPNRPGIICLLYTSCTNKTVSSDQVVHVQNWAVRVSRRASSRTTLRATVKAP